MRFTLLFAILFTHCLAQAGTLTGRVVRITDGDTLVVLDANEAQHKIRLAGIDAPERGQAFGTKSKEHLSDSVAGKFVVVEYDKRDRYERILGKVLLSGEDMNLEQIKAGLAWHYKKYQNEQSTTDRVKYSDAEREARMAKRGLWHDANPMHPWDYRKGEWKQKKAMEPFIIGPESTDKQF
jgi:endonuclease YncB( thermonuclease family)